MNDDSAGDDSGEEMEGHKVLAKVGAFCLCARWKD